MKGLISWCCARTFHRNPADIVEFKKVNKSRMSQLQNNQQGHQLNRFQVVTDSKIKISTNIQIQQVGTNQDLCQPDKLLSSPNTNSNNQIWVYLIQTPWDSHSLKVDTLACRVDSSNLLKIWVSIITMLSSTITNRGEDEIELFYFKSWEYFDLLYKLCN